MGFFFFINCWFFQQVLFLLYESPLWPFFLCFSSCNRVIGFDFHYYSLGIFFFPPVLYDELSDAFPVLIMCCRLIFFIVSFVFCFFMIPLFVLSVLFFSWLHWQFFFVYNLSALTNQEIIYNVRVQKWRFKLCNYIYLQDIELCCQCVLLMCHDTALCVFSVFLPSFRPFVFHLILRKKERPLSVLKRFFFCFHNRSSRLIYCSSKGIEFVSCSPWIESREIWHRVSSFVNKHLNLWEGEGERERGMGDVAEEMEMW